MKLGLPAVLLLAVTVGTASAALVLGLVSLARLLQRKSAASTVARIGGAQQSPDAAAEGDVVPRLPSALIVPPSEPHRPARESKTGYLTIDALPWGQVTIDGKPVGQTPIHAYPAGTGLVLVTLRSPVTGKAERRDVRLAPGQLLHLQVDLR